MQIRNVSHSPRVCTRGPQGMAPFWKGMESPGGRSWLEEVGHWWQLLRFHILFPFCLLSTSWLWTQSNQLPQAPGNVPSSLWQTLSSQTESQGASFLPTCQLSHHSCEERKTESPMDASPLVEMRDLTPPSFTNCRKVLGSVTA